MDININALFGFYSRLKPLSSFKTLDYFTEKSRNRYDFLLFNYASSVKLASIVDFIKEKKLFGFIPSVIDSSSVYYAIPICSYSGTLIGLYFRDICSESKSHYIFGDPDLLKFSVSTFFFNPEWKSKKYKDPIILVEGIIDMLAVASVYPYVIASLGKGYSFDEIRILSYLSSRYYRFFDRDTEGFKIDESIAGILSKFGINSSRIDSISCSDPGEFIDKAKMSELELSIRQLGL